MTIQFPDKSVTYSTFLDDIASRVVALLKKDANDPEYISQRKAFEIFGRRNVERWRRLGRVKPSKRPGKVNARPQIYDSSNVLNKTIYNSLGRSV